VVDHELAWLKDASRETPSALEAELPAVLDLARQLAERYGVALETSIEPDLPVVTVHPTALRQTLISLLSVAIPRASGGRVAISARAQRWVVELGIVCSGYVSGPETTSDTETARLDMARQLVRLSGGRLALALEARSFEARLTLPARERLPVLVIDDNADTLQLLQRYAAGTRYHLVTAQDPGQALDLVARHAPQLIVLDVMMPQVDGWAILGQLGQHPLTQGLPIVVCSILAEEELALFLGARAYLQKPVTRQAFLAVLDRLLAATEPGSR
jgi:CheY-like chemotaxis protein